nr:hypothetical protein [Tanacetum cinerariifolium]
MKATSRKLAYVDFDKEAPARSLAKGFSDRFSFESSGTFDTHRQTRSTSKIQKTPFKNKDLTYLRRSRRLEGQSTTKEKARMKRSKSKEKRSKHQEISLDFKYEEGSNDTYEDLNSPNKRPKPTSFTQRITRFKYNRREKLPRNIRVYRGNKDPEDHLGIFLAKVKQEEWMMPVCIKRRQNKGLKAFMDRFKSKSSHIKGVPPVLRISSFMHGHGHLELAKKLNEKIPKTVDEMFKRVRVFIRGEVAAESAKMKRYFHPIYQDSKRDPFHEKCELPRTIAFDRTSQKQNLNKFCDYQGDRGHNTNDCYELKKQIEEAMVLGKLAHLVKDICWNNQWNGNQGRNGMKVINMIKEEGNRKRPFEKGRFGLMSELTFSTIPRSQLTDKPIIFEGVIKGNQVRRILIDGESSYEHCFRNIDIDIRLRLRSQIRIAKDDKEKTGFHTKEGVYCFTHMPKELKISAATLQRMMEKVLANQIGRNVEIHLEEVVLKSKTISNFISKLAELKHPIREAQTRMETAKESGWTNEAEEALQRIKRKLGKLQTLMVQELIHTTRSSIAIFRKHKVKVINDGPMEEILKPSGKEGRLVRWAAEIWTYDISYTSRREVEGLVVNKFFGQGEQVEETPDANKGGTLNLSRKLQVKPTQQQGPRGVAISVSKGMKDLYVFMDSPKLVAQTE